MPDHWSKDFVEHLRAVHFALVLLCVAAIIIASARTKTEVERAHEQINQIQELVNTWDPRILQSAVDPNAASSVNVVGITNNVIRIKIGGEELLCKPELRPPAAFVTLNQKIAAATNGSEDGGSDDSAPGPAFSRRPGDVVPRPKTVEDFENTWNALLAGATLQKPLGVYDTIFGRTTPGGPAITKGSWELEPGTPNPDDVKQLQLRLQPVASSTLAQMQKMAPEVKADYNLVGSVSGSRRFSLHFPIEDMEQVPVDAQALLLQKTKGLRHGRFNEVFRELDSVTKEYKSTDLATAEKIVAAEEARSGEGFDAFGMKFPASASVGWGLIIVMVVQYYLFVLLYENRAGGASATDDVPWVGAYKSYPARFLTAGSALALPVAAVTALAIRGLYVHQFKWWSWGILVCAISAAVALAAGCYSVWPGYRSKLEPPISE